MCPARPSVFLLALAVPVIAAPGFRPPYGEIWDDVPDPADLGLDPRGSAALSSSAFTVQAKVTVDYVYTVGPGGMAPGDSIRVEDPLLHGMRWSKYGVPKLDPAECTPFVGTSGVASNSLVTLSWTGTATLGLERNTTGEHPLEYAYTDAWIETGSLAQGDTITLRYGDTSTNPDCGHQMPDRAFRAVTWRSYERIGGETFTPLEPAPTFAVMAEREVALLDALAPSVVQTGQPFTLKVDALDRLGNPVPAWGETAGVDAAYGGARDTFGPDNPGWLDFRVTIDEPGVHRIGVTAGRFSVRSNPVLVADGSSERRVFWGDIHAHHGNSAGGSGAPLEDENHVYGRDVRMLDFAGETMKFLRYTIGAEALWEQLRSTCTAQTRAGSYVVLLGEEWMGEGSRTEDGHHDVYFDDCVGALGDHDAITGLSGTTGLLQWARDLTANQGTRVVVVPHATAMSGSNWNAYDEDLRVGIEVYSEWGDSLDSPESGNVAEALAAGHWMGFYASSDNHDGWFGNPLSAHDAPSGLAAFYAPELTRAALFDAFQGRQVYGTSGARILLSFDALAGGDMVRSGSVLLTNAPDFAWEVHGTAGIASVRLDAVAIERGAVPRTLTRALPGAEDHEGSFAWKDWDGTPQAVWLVVSQVDGQRAWSSPIWITQDCGDERAVDPEGICARDSGRDSGAETGAADSAAADSSPRDSGGVDPPARRACLCADQPGSPAGALAAFGLAGLLARRRRRA